MGQVCIVYLNISYIVPFFELTIGMQLPTLRTGSYAPEQVHYMYICVVLCVADFTSRRLHVTNHVNSTEKIYVDFGKVRTDMAASLSTHLFKHLNTSG